MGGLPRVPLLVLAAVIATAVLAPALQSPGDDPSAPRAGFELVASNCVPTKADKNFTRKMNAERDKEGLGNMRLDPELVRVAKKHTKAMIADQTLEHSSPDELGSRVTNWAELGENIGAGNTVSSLHTAFMNSKSHRDNILYSKFKHVGVGSKKDSSGKLWVTVVFEASKDPGTTVSGC